MIASDFYVRCLEQASFVMQRVQPEQFGSQTPDTDWNVHTLANHMLYELAWVPEILAGSTIAEVGAKYDGDLVGDGTTVPLGERWEQSADLARASVQATNLEAPAHLSYTDTSVEEYLLEAGSDQLIHAWDLGTAIGVEVKFDPEMAQVVYDRILPDAGNMAATGLFKPVLQVPAEADLQTKLLALYGRDARWRPER